MSQNNLCKLDTIAEELYLCFWVSQVFDDATSRSGDRKRADTENGYLTWF